MTKRTLRRKVEGERAQPPIRSKPPLRTILDVYDAFLREDDFGRVAAILQIDLRTLHSWLSEHSELAEAKDLAGERRGRQDSLANYVFQRLTPDAKKTWDEIKFWDGHESAFEKVEAILSGQTKRVKQELFIHALVTSGFDPSSACRIIGVPRWQLKQWSEEPEFRQLIEEIQWHKKNFYERRLVDLIECGHPGAIIFANRTINGDRGYSERLKLEHSGTIDGGGIKFEDLDLDVDTKVKVLEAIRRRQEELKAPEQRMIPQGAITV